MLAAETRCAELTALSELNYGVAALARVRNVHGLATVATPVFSLENALLAFDHRSVVDVFQFFAKLRRLLFIVEPLQNQ